MDPFSKNWFWDKPQDMSLGPRPQSRSDTGQWSQTRNTQWTCWNWYQSHNWHWQHLVSHGNNGPKLKENTKLSQNRPKSPKMTKYWESTQFHTSCCWNPTISHTSFCRNFFGCPKMDFTAAGTGEWNRWIPDSDGGWNWEFLEMLVLFIFGEFWVQLPKLQSTLGLSSENYLL